MKIILLDSHGNSNIRDQRVLSLPAFLEIKFEEEGRFNIVLMAPGGWGAAYYSGRAFISRLSRWGIPVHQQVGKWQIIAVNLDQRTMIASHETLEFFVDMETKVLPTYREARAPPLHPEIEALQIIPWKILFPLNDCVVISPLLWITGEGQNRAELYINGERREIRTYDSKNFFEPLKLVPGAQTIIIESRNPGNRFNHSINIYYLDTAVRQTVEPIGRMSKSLVLSPVCT